MAKIAHIVNLFDPACDVLRCYRELHRFSRHEHRLFVKDAHPLQRLYQYAQHSNEDRREDLLEWCDAVIYHFVGWEGGPDRPEKPAAFRNINIRWNQDTGRFWCEPQYNAASLGRYKMFASSHAGAMDFLPNCRLLPDLIPVDKYIPDWSDREPCISFIKHSEDIDKIELPVARQRLLGRPHAEILERRKTEATVCIDNVCDGHYGLAGLESMALGLPTVVFNQMLTRAALDTMAPVYPPFLECAPTLGSAVAMAEAHSDRRQGRESRAWMEEYYNSQRLIGMYWDPFVEALLG